MELVGGVTVSPGVWTRSLIALFVVVLLGMAPVDMHASGVPSRAGEQVWHGRDDRSASHEFIQDSGVLSAKPAHVVAKMSSCPFPGAESLVAARVVGLVLRVAVPVEPLLARSPWVGVVELRI